MDSKCIWGIIRLGDAFRVIVGKGMVNDYWILYLFEIISVFGMWYCSRIVKACKIFIEKGVVYDY